MAEKQKSIALIFDADDTLYNQIQPFAGAIQTVWPEIYARLLPQLNDVFVASRRYSDEVFEKSRSGEITMEEMYIYRIKSPLRDFGEEISDETALEYQRRYAENLYHLHLTEYMEGILERLSGCGSTDACRVSLGILTNGPSEHQWKKLRSLGVERWIRQDHIIVSGDVGCTKPGEEIFQVTRQKFPEAEEFYMIGDSIDTDIVGADRAGWKTVWYNHRHKENHSGISPDYEVHSEEELGRLLVSLTDRTK